MHLANSTAPASSWVPSPSGIIHDLVGGLAGGLAGQIVRGWFESTVHVVTSLAEWATHETWRTLSSSTEPVLSGAAFRAEFHVMAVLALAVILPMLCAGIIQSIARQDGSALLRTALIRLPFAVVFTGIVVELVSLCLSATDQASTALLSAAGDPARRLFTGLSTAVVSTSLSASGIGAALLVAGTMAVVAFVLWVELAVRSAAVAAATLFLPLALAGLAWPATTQWARRLGETIAGLVLMKLVIAGVLALAATAIGGHRGIPGIVEGIALLGLATFTPFALLRLIPMIEAGAVAHLEAAHHRTTGIVTTTGKQAKNAWLATSGAFAQPEVQLGADTLSPTRIDQHVAGGQTPGGGGGSRAPERDAPGSTGATGASRAEHFQAEIDAHGQERDDAA